MCENKSISRRSKSLNRKTRLILLYNAGNNIKNIFFTLKYVVQNFVFLKKEKYFFEKNW